MKIDIAISGKQTSAAMKAAQKQATYAAIQTINSIAFSVRSATHEVMADVFDRPKPNFTLRSMVVEKATKLKPWAWVGLRKDGGFRQSLSAHFIGGRRRFKGFEGWLRSLGVIRPGYIAVPTDNARLDSYGNQALSEIKAIMSASWRTDRATKGLAATVTKGKGKRAASIGYFMIPSNNMRGLSPGVYRRIRVGKGTDVQLVVAFVKPGEYDRTIKLEEIAQAAGAGAGTIFANHFSKAMATAK